MRRHADQKARLRLDETIDEAAPRGRSWMTNSPPARKAIIIAPMPRLWLKGLSE